MSVLYLCGAGNPEGVRLAIRVNEQCRGWNRIVLLDDDPQKQGGSILGVEVAGPFADLAGVDPGTSEVANLVARKTSGRWAVRERLLSYGLPFATLVHPTVDMGGVEFEDGIVVYQNATVGPAVTLGEGSVVFMGAVAGHGSQVGRCCVLAPNCAVNARVVLGDGVYVGTNATILPEVNVGSWATIAAGSVVMRDVPEGASVMGAPAKVLPSFDKTKKPTSRPSLHVTTGGAGSR